ncbi:molybdopterin-containing oxidoreductase family protein [Ignicoccus hospitalis]|uniref:Molybdopterin oxidoreductase n=1 Tax=Ignicoccus hospitalis (strain KIN4/I / DSM 18386 / JCM 14125) TaxID=453591 RepID=A8AAN2_IGNH4|nr:molybdopterin-dependent oxidoreductase [Ignicoccus hospitalis]ABU81984.1 molybdopterin oxidoreductase [Ignicoccus hospitalis KIN4/I]HIH89857.1 molybdopterin-dependent oxidoreductase [Desulfurococcaceae archaeon]
MKILSKLSVKPFNVPLEGLEKERASGVKLVPNICRMCTASCSILVEVRNGKAVRVYGNPYATYHNKGHVCPRGNSGPLQLENPDRLRTPLKRRGSERGSWDFEEVDYKTAIAEMASIIKEKLEEGAPWKVVLVVGQAAAAAYNDPISMAIAPTIGTDNVINIPLSTCIGSKLLSWGFSGAPGHHAFLVPDYERTKYFLSFGRNLGGSVAVGQTAKAGAKLGSYKLVVMDPRLSEWAAKADEWVPVKPGTDLAVFLAMLNVIINEGLYDETYLKKYTNAPMLIYKDTLELVETKNIVVKNPMKEFEVVDFLVFDEASDSFKFSREAKLPSLTYEGEYEGKPVTTVFNALKEHLKDYTPEWAERVSGVPKEVVEKLAAEFAMTRPAAVETGWSANKYFNHFQLYRAAAVLSIVTGNFLRPGGVVLSMGGIGKVLQRAAPPVAGPPVKEKPSKLYEYESETPIALSDGTVTKGPLIPWGRGYHGLLRFVEENKGVVIIILGGNPARTFMGQAFQKVAKHPNVEKIIDIGLMKDDSVLYSDLFIPECGYLERYNVLSGIPFSLAKGFMAAFPAVEAECKDMLTIWADAFRELGLLEKYLSKLENVLCPGCDVKEALEKGDFESVIRKQCEKQGVKFDDVKNKGIVYLTDDSWGLEMNAKILENGWLNTASGKVEILPLKLLKIIKSRKGELKPEWHPLPTWVPPIWMRKALASDEFVLLTGKEKNMSYTWLQPNPLLSWIVDDSKKIWINKARGQRLGINDGEVVEVCAGEECVRGPAKLTEGIVPEAIYVPPNYGFEVKLTFGKYKDLKFNVLQSPFLIDPVTGTHLLSDVIVKVKR